MTETEGPSKKDRLNGLVSAGADIAGAAIGGALGFLATGPVGAAAGSVAGVAAAQALQKVGTEATERLLGPREQVRVGGAIAIAAEHIRGRIQRGDMMRMDGFFENHHNGRTDAEEVAEHVLLTSQREAEERKIPYMAFLLANISFDSSISAPLAHQIIRAAETMSYRQLCLLKLSALRGNYSLRTADYRGQGRFEKSLYEVLYECLDLYLRGFVNFGGEVLFGPSDVYPSRMTLQGIGLDIFQQMGLATIPERDVQEVARRLS